MPKRKLGEKRVYIKYKQVIFVKNNLGGLNRKSGRVEIVSTVPRLLKVYKIKSKVDKVEKLWPLQFGVVNLRIRPPRPKSLAMEKGFGRGNEVGLEFWGHCISVWPNPREKTP